MARNLIIGDVIVFAIADFSRATSCIRTVLQLSKKTWRNGSEIRKSRKKSETGVANLMRLGFSTLTVWVILFLSLYPTVLTPFTSPRLECDAVQPSFI